MNAPRRAVVVLTIAACAAGLVWMVRAKAVSSGAVANATVVGAVAAVVTVAVVVLPWWRRRAVPSATTVAAGLDAAVRYLAVETLRYWRQQAKVRRITTPSPAEVRWSWAGPDVAAPPPLAPALLTAGVVTRLREQLYQPDTGHAAERIVILGGPGAGKTTAMLLLLIDILEHRPAGASQPVPVWLTLGGWNPDTTSLADWAAQTLTRDYPSLTADAYGGPATTAVLLRTGQIALFCDGLDEMADTLRAQALRRIDEEAQGLRVVLTSRPDEYTAAVTQQRLWGAAVVEVLPVTAEHARDFLLHEQLGQRRGAWQQVTDHIRDHPASVAAQTLTSPLALSLARDAYAHTDPTALLNANAFPTPAALLRHLLAQTLVIAYPDQAEHDHATRWLAWIAYHMGTSHDLRWWDIPPGWPAAQRPSNAPSHASSASRPGSLSDCRACSRPG